MVKCHATCQWILTNVHFSHSAICQPEPTAIQCCMCSLIPVTPPRVAEPFRSVCGAHRVENSLRYSKWKNRFSFGYCCWTIYSLRSIQDIGEEKKHRLMLPRSTWIFLRIWNIEKFVPLELFTMWRGVNFQVDVCSSTLQSIQTLQSTKWRKLNLQSSFEVYSLVWME